MDLSRNNINKTIAISLLQTMGRYDRVGGINLSKNNITPDEGTITELKHAFQHDQIDRILIFQDLCFEIPAAQSEHPRLSDKGHKRELCKEGLEHKEEKRRKTI